MHGRLGNPDRSVTRAGVCLPTIRGGSARTAGRAPMPAATVGSCV
jgi:hypothetical protein